MENKARIVNILLDKYVLETENGECIEAIIRKNAKKGKSILVGDNVVYEKIDKDFVISKILDRKNELIRPPVANIDNLVIVVSIANPSPDYILLDKEIALCEAKNITPIICVNKIDLDDNGEIKYIKKVYSKLGIKVIYTSAKEGIGIDDLKKCLKGKVSAFSGNSGVGKSSISKTIIGEENIVVGEISEKSNKGKHTTKHVKLYKIEEDTYILDTPGFSSFELYDIPYKELKKYYTDFLEYHCDYDDCNHVNEKEDVCTIKKNVELGNIDKARYERYVYIFEKLKEKEDRKYK